MATVATKEAMITLEHLGDQCWLFDTADGTGHLTIGSCIDTDEHLRKIEAVRDPRWTPDPKVTMTRQDWDALTPHGRDTIRILVRDGEMRLHEGDIGTAFEVMREHRPSWEAGDAA